MAIGEQCEYRIAVKALQIPRFFRFKLLCAIPSFCNTSNIIWLSYCNKITRQTKIKYCTEITVGDKNMEFAMLSEPLHTRTVHSKPSGESKSNVAYCLQVLCKSQIAVRCTRMVAFSERYSKSLCP